MVLLDVFLEYEELEEEGRKRRSHFVRLYTAFPPSGSAAYWRALRSPSLPLEVLVLAVRSAGLDEAGRNTILEILIQRIQRSCEYWARCVVRSLSSGEHIALVEDLCADLYESLIRLWLDPHAHFWEENFQHSLLFQRRKIYKRFLLREGFDQNRQGKRIPRSLFSRLEYHEGVISPFETLDRTELYSLVQLLPEKLRTAVLFVFWYGWTEKDTARVLGVTDRTIRNRLRKAFLSLRSILD
ncbi:hypothetical protein KTH_43260 [Thermosporothrix hazakensis]|nr:hypothetical protein KTH_43260 [Thermosporothrix hazakensis]